MFTRNRVTNVMYALLSLVFSLILFFSTKSSNFTAGILSPNRFEETIQAVVIQPNYDADKYFIQGYEPTVTVRLSSLNRILLNGEINEETRTFRVVADLTQLEEGTHVVPLKVQNLISGVEASIEPTSITVTIERLETKIFPVEVNISNQNLAEGYQLTGAKVNPAEVEVRTGHESMLEIAQVVANLDSLEGINQNLSKEIPIYAVDKNGEILNTILSPEKVLVTLEIKAPQKEVPLTVEQTGTLPQGISHFEIRLSQQTAVLIGSLDLLANYQSLSVPIDISKIKEYTERSVTLSASEGVFVHPQQVLLTITPVPIVMKESSEDSKETSEESKETINSKTQTQESNTTDQTSETSN